MGLFQAIAWLVQSFYQLIPNYAVAIALLTLTVMIVLTPLTLKSTRSIMQMQALQPEIKKLQAQYKDDRQKLNEEMMRFYKENNISPLGGCLPMLIQMPIYFILYRVLRELTHKVNGAFDPRYISHSSKLYESLKGQTTMKSFGVDLADNASHVMTVDGFLKALPYFILIVLVAGSTYIQQKQISARNPGAAQANPMNQSLLRIMPIFMAFICLRLPGALVLYMFVSNLYRVGQQQVISHTIYKPAQRAGMFDGAVETTSTSKEKDSPKPVTSKGFLQGLLGDSVPKLGKGADHGFKDSNGSGNGTRNGNGAGTKGSGSKATSSGSAKSSPAKPARSTTAKSTDPAKTPPARPQGGRITPTGSRPAGASRKKKRR